MPSIILYSLIQVWWDLFVEAVSAAPNISEEAVSAVPNLFADFLFCFYMVHILDLMVPASKNMTVWAKGEMGSLLCSCPMDFFGPQGKICGCRVMLYWNFPH